MESVSLQNIAFDEKGLVPAVVQDARTGDVLMVAYMNRESLIRTVESGETWFYSRSRQKLWHKGEESGHFQHVRRIYVDCDEDTLVVEVVPDGPACHTGNRTCFFRSLSEWENQRGPGSLRVLRDLWEEIQDRRAHPQEKSYTNYLQQEGKIRSTRRSARKPPRSSLPISMRIRRRSSASPVICSIICLCSGKMPGSP